MIVLLLHGLYACILYLFNCQEKALFIVILLTLSTGVAIMTGYDNLLLLLLPINYTWAVKIRLFAHEASLPTLLEPRLLLL
ncbi:hypothetical protein ACFQI7_32090 [Paenibacillus allorhizosphaerae]|uniref:Uncharacterized protein n=1 Tax=Paenibacillus allorhizosphaerae TaxID=2849866 RepID=A0ABM8VQB9_9BACL|nr:hypothetical protein [Paenibacillus allorhizosphaerae]CAG7653995.1 hypothetical protein PAECIP111802_05645 [Paenibacillus allorhizosphaerae]